AFRHAERTSLPYIHNGLGCWTYYWKRLQREERALPSHTRFISSRSSPRSSAGSEARKPCCTGSGNSVAGPPNANFRGPTGALESEQQGNSVSEVHCRRAAARKALFFVRH